VSGADELLARIDKYLASFGRIYDSGPSLSESLLRDCRTRITANAALADENARLTAKCRAINSDPDACNGFFVNDSETGYRYEPECIRWKRENAALAARCEKARADALEEAAKLCDAIDRENCEWIERNADDLGDAYKHADGASDGANACAAAIRSLASQAEGER
jgi:hypothetical protein